MTNISHELKKPTFKKRPKFPPILANKETKSILGDSVDKVYANLSENTLKRITFCLTVSGVRGLLKKSSLKFGFSLMKSTKISPIKSTSAR